MESVIPVEFQGEHIADAKFDGVSFVFKLSGNIERALLTGKLAYVSRFRDVESQVTLNGKTRHYVKIDVIEPTLYV